MTRRIWAGPAFPSTASDERLGRRASARATGFDTIEFAIAEIAAGRPVVVVDDEDRENEGDLIFAAELATPELVGFTVRYSSGVICVPLTGAGLRAARPAADVPGQPGPQGHRLHRLRRREGRASPPGSRRPSGRTRSECWPIRRAPSTT